MENSEAKKSFGENVSEFLVSKLEALFRSHGEFVASHPFVVMTVSTTLCFAAAFGCFSFRIESRPEKLWIPENSEFSQTLEWQKENYPDDMRIEMVLYEADNVLKPEYIKEMLYLKENISSLWIQDSKGLNHTFEDMCFRVPSLGGKSKSSLINIRKKLFNNTEGIGFDWSQELSRNVYCTFFDLMPTACLSLGILDIWDWGEVSVEELSQEDILQGINVATESATYAYPINFTSFLGGISRNETGHIVGARSSLHLWNMQINREQMESETDQKFSAGMDREVNEALYRWEEAFIDSILRAERLVQTKDLKILPQAVRSFMDVSEKTIFGDVKYLIIGSVVLYTYVFLVIGKFNMVETRPVLTTLGITSIYLSMGFSFGVCGLLGVVYGPVHSILPLLLIGLGVDDIFVIVQSLEVTNKNQENSRLSYTERMGKVLESSGVAITVTSLTDCLAFGIGSTASLPALHSFCIYAAVATLSLYLMQITFFFAALTLDQRRLEANRNGYLWCIKHHNWEPNECSQKVFSQLFMESVFAPWLIKPSSKAVILVATAILTGLSIWGTSTLRQEFCILRFLPSSSYVSNFLHKLEEYYPEAGHVGTVYFDDIDLPRELPKVKWLTNKLENSHWISNVDSWYDPLKTYMLTKSKVDFETEEADSALFSDILVQFLFSPNGTKFQANFYSNSTLQCSDDSFHILASKFNYQHHILQDRDDQIAAMDEVKALVKQANFSGFSACTSFSYNDWETNKTIVKDVVQNLTLALVAVFVMTSLLIANFRASLLVLLCVTLTLIDVMALMSWWDLTIDIMTCIHLVLCVGLSVDYSTHIALHFMKVHGSKDERVVKTVSEVGSPIFNGAFSTFLGFVFLANSKSYVFESFFKIFFGVFIYGVFHSLFFLPVVMSLIGPRPHHRNQMRHKEKFSSNAAEEAMHLSKASAIS